MRVRTYTLLAVVITVLAVGSRLPALAVAVGEARSPEKVFLGFEVDRPFGLRLVIERGLVVVYEVPG